PSPRKTPEKEQSEDNLQPADPESKQELMEKQQSQREKDREQDRLERQEMEVDREGFHQRLSELLRQASLEPETSGDRKTTLEQVDENHKDLDLEDRVDSIAMESLSKEVASFAAFSALEQQEGAQSSAGGDGSLYAHTVTDSQAPDLPALQSPPRSTRSSLIVPSQSPKAGKASDQSHVRWPKTEVEMAKDAASLRGGRSASKDPSVSKEREEQVILSRVQTDPTGVAVPVVRTLRRVQTTVVPRKPMSLVNRSRSISAGMGSQASEEGALWPGGGASSSAAAAPADEAKPGCFRVDFDECVKLAKKHKMNISKIKSAMEEFLRLDVGKDGTLNMKEFEEAIRARTNLPPNKPVPDHLLDLTFGKADNDGSGIVYFEEFLVWSTNHAFSEELLVQNPE
ncbi:unnamed protein product, partial [Polarella glacialis]